MDYLNILPLQIKVNSNFASIPRLLAIITVTLVLNLKPLKISTVISEPTKALKITILIELRINPIKLLLVGAKKTSHKIEFFLLQIVKIIILFTTKPMMMKIQIFSVSILKILELKNQMLLQISLKSSELNHQDLIIIPHIIIARLLILTGEEEILMILITVSILL